MDCIPRGQACSWGLRGKCIDYTFFNWHTISRQAIHIMLALPSATKYLRNWILQIINNYWTLQHIISHEHKPMNKHYKKNLLYIVCSDWRRKGADVTRYQGWAGIQSNLTQKAAVCRSENKKEQKKMKVEKAWYNARTKSTVFFRRTR